MATIAAAFVHFLLQSAVLLGALLVFRRMPDLTFLPVFLLALRSPCCSAPRSPSG
jgi:hypothetical protein